MRPRRRIRYPATVLAAVILASGGCGATEGPPGPRTVQPGAPGEESRVLDPGAVSAGQAGRYTAADVRFMQGMLVHHAQALVMTDLVDGRGASEAVRLMARRIEISQASEMDLMRHWLAERDEPLSAPDGAGQGEAGGHGHMPGMATAADLARLAGARGSAFDRLFLELMIRHHQGALVMVADLLATEGAGLEPELFQFLSHVDADQRAEIARMQGLLRQMQNDPPERGRV